MLQNFTTNAINLRSYNLSESDKIIVMYSRDKGLIRGVAKGSKKTTSKLGGRMDLLVANKILLNKGKNLDVICQAEALNTFFNLRNDMDKLLFSLYTAEIVANFGVEDDPNSEEIYSLFYAYLNRVSIAKTKTEILLALLRFQLKIMSLVGYAPGLCNCVKCASVIQNDENIYFSVKNGGLICQHCKTNDESLRKIHYKIKDFLLTLSDTDFDEKTRYDELANEKICLVCVNLMKEYTEFYSPKKFQTTKVLEQI